MHKDTCHFLECSYLGKEEGMGFLDSRPFNELVTVPCISLKKNWSKYAKMLALVGFKK